MDSINPRVYLKKWINALKKEEDVLGKMKYFLKTRDIKSFTLNIDNESIVFIKSTPGTELICDVCYYIYGDFIPQRNYLSKSKSSENIYVMFYLDTKKFVRTTLWGKIDTMICEYDKTIC